jgi:O-antigen/teichoic acid export membrane protein
MSAFDQPGSDPPHAGRFVGSPTLSLRVRAARGVLVNAGFNIAVQVLTAIQGLALAGLLTVEQYGLWGLITVTLGTLLWLGAVGLDDKYIQQDEPDQTEAFQVAFTLQSALCALFMVVVAVAMPLFALAYDEPELVAPALVLGLAAMPAIALQTPLWVFYRQMDFVRQRRLQLWGPVVSLVLLVPLAIAGFGIWAAVWATLASSWVMAFVAVRASPYPLRLRWRTGAVREYTSFSLPLFVSSSTGVLTAQIPVLVAANSLGLGAIAALTLANTIAVFAYRVDHLVTGTLYPAICAVADRLDLLYETFSKSNRLALMWALPCGAGVVLFAEDFLVLVLGEEWRFATLLVQVAGAAAAVNQIAFNWSAFYRARGQTVPIAIVDATAFAVVMLVGVPLLASDGLTGYAIGIAAATGVGLALRLVYVARLFPALRIAAHVGRAALPTVPAVAAVLLVRLLDGSRTPGRALAEALLFLVVGAAASIAAERRLLAESLRYLRGRALSAPA